MKQDFTKPQTVEQHTSNCTRKVCQTSRKATENSIKKGVPCLHPGGSGRNDPPLQ